MKILEALGKTKKAIGGIIAIIIVCLLIFFAGTQFASNSDEPKITSTGLTQQLQDIEELATLSYNYTKVGEFSNSLQFNGWDIPLTQKSFLITYDGSLKAGIKMDKIQVDISDNIITVSIPEIEILSNEIDESSIEVYDETRNIFNPISVNDYATFATSQKEAVEAEAIENGLLSEAATRTQDTIKKYLNALPGVEDNYDIEVQFIDSNS
ncbi:DUF4230 domain-containing protein [uncultured Thomasclavelia sp.]|uniref:DUF4230 domain-containing protein n=1 Tax=uncultured Thomasclavelia sp. TaxID=3025759 RepID=UPI0025F4C727|nr:DUF4230 domain-containing protein [uncultured Thomasclavelia sp.]